MDILAEYKRIVAKEFELQGLNSLETCIFLHEAKEIQGLCWQILEVAKSAFVPRSFVQRYGLLKNEDLPEGMTVEQATHESDAAHALLVEMLVDRALIYQYGPDFGEPDGEFTRTYDGYSYREVMTAARIHDLPENESGDIPDNGSGDSETKRQFEMDYFGRFTNRYPLRELDFKVRVQSLLMRMQDRKSQTGRLLYVADKTAAIIGVLAEDWRVKNRLSGRMPMMRLDDPAATDRDRQEMMTCDPNGDFGDWRKASEMWTIDHLAIRKIAQYDDTGFFTAVIVMLTLMVNGLWYVWREDEYT